MAVSAKTVDIHTLLDAAISFLSVHSTAIYTVYSKRQADGCL